MSNDPTAMPEPLPEDPRLLYKPDAALVEFDYDRTRGQGSFQRVKTNYESVEGVGAFDGILERFVRENKLLNGDAKWTAKLQAEMEQLKQRESEKEARKRQEEGAQQEFIKYAGREGAQVFTGLPTWMVIQGGQGGLSTCFPTLQARDYPLAQSGPQPVEPTPHVCPEHPTVADAAYHARLIEHDFEKFLSEIRSNKDKEKNKK